MGVFNMPSLGADMEAGKLVEWMVKPGDTVKRGDIIAVVETQKGAIEIEVFEDGVVDALLADLGSTLPVGTPLAMIRGAGETDTAEPPEPPRETPHPAPPPAAEPVPAPAAPAGSGVAASPAARARAAELGLDLSTVRGSGPNGAVVLADVEAGAPATKPSPAAPTDRQAALAEMRTAIAAAMARSKREIPHYYVTHTVDLTNATAWLTATNADRPPDRRLLMGALLAHAVACAAREVGPMNGHYVDGIFVPAGEVHLGLAIALRGGGLVAPAILDAATLSLDALMAAMRDLTTRARAGRLKGSEMTKATITLSALGESGVEQMAGVIVPPQVAIVTAGAPRAAASVRGDEVVVADAITLTLAADHRVSDGRLGAKLLSLIDDALQHPETL